MAKLKLEDINKYKKMETVGDVLSLIMLGRDSGEYEHDVITESWMDYDEGWDNSISLVHDLFAQQTTIDDSCISMKFTDYNEFTGCEGTISFDKHIDSTEKLTPEAAINFYNILDELCNFNSKALLWHITEDERFIDYIMKGLI